MTSFYGGGAVSTSGGGSTPTKGALIFKGTLGISDDGATVLALPDAHEEGWTYLVVTAGTYAGQLCEKGDFVICVSSGEAASDLDWTVVQGNTFNTLPTPTALDEGKIISVDTSGNYILIDNPSSGETENLPDPSEADEGKILSVGADGNYILTDNSAKDKLDKANPTYTGSLTGENAAFSGIVTVATPAADGEAANKGYVDATKTELEGDINTLQQTVTSQTETINTLNQQVTNITGGTVELPYLKNTGDNGTGVYDFTGATVNAADPVDNSNVATKHYVDQKIASAGGTGEIVSYTQGDGISISLENEISLSIDSAGANGLKVGTNGLGLDLATATTSGAMAASDKTAIASNTTEITNIKNGTTELPYLKETNPTYEGTLIGGDATFTGSVQVSTPDQDNEAANKSYVDAIHVQAVADAKNYIDSEITNLENGTTELPYIKNNGDTVTGNYNLTGAAVTIAEPASDNSPATKKYVDDSISTIDVSEQIAPLTERVTAAEGEIDTLQTDVEAVETSVANITNGTTELPYVKDSGDTVTGTYNFTGANVTIAEPTVSNNPATKNYVDTKIASAGGSGEVVSYTQGNGINISPENIISVVIAADNANGLAVDTSGIKLNVATSTTAGAMSGADKAKLDASSTTEQMNQAISNAIDEALEDPTKLPFVNINGDTMHGSLTTTGLFTDFVTIRNAGTDGNTGFQNNSDTDHIRVYDKVADTLVPIEVGEPVNNQDASTKKYVDDKVTEAIESLDEAKADKDNPTFTGIISGANATLSGTLTGNTATFSGGITVPLEPEAEGSATSKKYVDDAIAAVDAPEYTLTKQGVAEDGYFATYYLTKEGAQVGEKINIPKDYLVKEAELLEVAATDTPYSGAVIGDKYIDFTINTQVSDEDEQHIYLPVKDLVDVYTGGNGININASNVVSVQIDAANANGLALGSAGLKLNLATTSVAGAMSAADKTKIDTAISEEQLTAVENEIDTLQTEVNNIKRGTTDLGYLKAANPTYTGTMTGIDATFSGNVVIPTPDTDNEAANKSYVDNQIKNIKLSYYTPDVDEHGNLTWTGNNEGMPPVDSSNIMGPSYTLTEEDKQTIVQAVIAALPDGDAVSYGAPEPSIVTTNNKYYTAIAAAIREKLGTSTEYQPAQMAAAIENIDITQKIPITFTGNPIVATNTIIGRPFKGLKIYGKSNQESTQLLPITEPSYHVNGLTATLQDDGSLIVNGTPGSGFTNLIYIPLSLSPGDYYIAGGENTLGRVIAFIEIKKSTGISYFANQSFSVDGTETSIVFILQSNFTNAINNYRVPAMLNKGTKPLPVQKYNGTPSTERPIPIVSAGASGSIALSITDGAYQSQSLTVPSPNGLPGVPVKSSGNCTDLTGQAFTSDYWDFADGQQHILCGKIASYNSEEITTPYISSTGALTTGAQVLYVLPKPRTEAIPHEIMTAYHALNTYGGTTVISTTEPVVGIEATLYCDAGATVQHLQSEIQTLSAATSQLSQIVDIMLGESE